VCGFEPQRLPDLLSISSVFEEDPEFGALHKNHCATNQFPRRDAAVQENVRASAWARRRAWAGARATVARRECGTPRGSGKSLFDALLCARHVRYPAMANPTGGASPNRNEPR